MDMAETSARSTCSPRRSATRITARPASRAHLFPAGARGDREARKSKPGGMGHACEFETSMVQHLRPELVKIERAETCYPDPGSRYLTTDLLGSQAIRLYPISATSRPAARWAIRPLPSPEAGKAFFAAVVGELAAFIAGFPRLEHSGAAAMIGALKVGVIGLGFFGSRHARVYRRSSGRRADRRRDLDAEARRRDRRRTPARAALPIIARCWLCPRFAGRQHLPARSPA